MKAQTPAEGISLTRDFGGSKFYKVDCSCGNDDDQINFEVEAADWGEVSVHTWTTQKTEWWKDPFKQNDSYSLEPEWWYNFNYWIRGVLNGLAHRLRVTRDVWVNGYVRYEQCTVMSKQQALNYAETLKQAVKDVEDFKSKQKSGSRKLP